MSVDEHEDWLARVLGDPDSELWIAESEGRPVGQVRVTSAADGWAELHVTVAPEGRGRGIGAAMIALAVQRVAAGGGAGLVAHVKEGNRSSLRAFQRAGFALAGRDASGLLRLERRALS